MKHSGSIAMGLNQRQGYDSCDGMVSENRSRLPSLMINRNYLPREELYVQKYVAAHKWAT